MTQATQQSGLLPDDEYGRAFRLDGKVAVVTGAARGLGAETARALVLAGATVVVSDIDVAVGEGTAARLREAGGKAIFQQLNVTDEAGWEGVIADTIRQFGRIDVLVNNAGTERLSLITECSLDEFRFVMDVNVTGTFLGIKHAVRAMAPGGSSGQGGSIINISSAAGIIGVTGLSAYGAAKGAVRTLTKAAAVECARMRKNVRVNSIHPGVVQTEMATQFLLHYVEMGLAPDDATAEKASRMAHPMGRFGEPRDIASAVLYLASDASRWMTGAEMVVDGGLTAS